jgi:hypothetical protein
MAVKNNGTLKTLAILVSIAALAIGGCYAYSVSLSARVQAVAVAQSAADARDDAMREDIRDIKHEQRRQSAKLDDILKKLP